MTKRIVGKPEDLSENARLRRALEERNREIGRLEAEITSLRRINNRLRDQLECTIFRQLERA